MERQSVLGVLNKKKTSLKMNMNPKHTGRNCMLPEGDRDCPVHRKCKELWNKYKGDELQTKLAEATADEWLDMYRYKKFSMPKPKIALDYVNMQAIEKKTFDKENPEWHESQEMKSYADKEVASVQQMESNKIYLESSLEYLKTDVSRSGKIKAVLSGYPQATVRVAQPAANWHD